MKLQIFEESKEQSISDKDDETQAFIKALGGAENIVDTDACITRLRMQVGDSSILKDEDFIALGAKGVIRPTKTTIQIILGSNSEKVAEKIKEALS